MPTMWQWWHQSKLTSLPSLRLLEASQAPEDVDPENYRPSGPFVDKICCICCNIKITDGSVQSQDVIGGKSGPSCMDDFQLVVKSVIWPGCLGC